MIKKFLLLLFCVALFTVVASSCGTRTVKEETFPLTRYYIVTMYSGSSGSKEFKTNKVYYHDTYVNFAIDGKLFVVYGTFFVQEF